MTNSNLYNIFLTVAKCGNITKASNELYISQPAISNNIKQLEKEIGGKLFERQNKGVKLTNLGVILKDRLEPIMESLNGLQNIGKVYSELSVGYLRIGANSSNCNQIISNALIDFVKKYPSIKIEMIRGNQEELLEGLKNDKLDIVYMDDCIIPENIEVLKKYVIEYQLIGNREYYEKYKNKTLKIQNEIILPNRKNKSREFIDNYFKAKNITLSPKYELDNYILLYDFVKNGLGIAFVNLDYYKKNIEDKEVYILSPEYKINARRFVLLDNKSFKNPAKEKFLENIL